MLTYRKLKFTGGNNVTYDFSNYKTFTELFRDLYYEKMTIDEAQIKQDEFNSILAVSSNYGPRAQKYIEEKNKLLDNAKNFYEGTEKITESFKSGIFSLKFDDEFEEQQTSEKFNKKEPPIKPTKTDFDELNKLVIKKETDINKELFENYFKLQMPSAMLKTLHNLNDKKKNNLLVNIVKSSLSDLKNEIENMSEDEINTENSYKIVEIVEKILKFNQLKQQEGEG